MEERSMLKNQVLKTIAFLTLPIFAMIIIVDCIIIYYAVACPEIKENKDFYDTDMFIDSYMGEVERKMCIRDRFICIFYNYIKRYIFKS